MLTWRGAPHELVLKGFSSRSSPDPGLNYIMPKLFSNNKLVMNVEVLSAVRRTLFIFPRSDAFYPHNVQLLPFSQRRQNVFNLLNTTNARCSWAGICYFFFVPALLLFLHQFTLLSKMPALPDFSLLCSCGSHYFRFLGLFMMNNPSCFLQDLCLMLTKR